MCERLSRASTRDLGTRDGGGRADVQRRDVTVHRDRRDDVAARPREARQPPALGTEDEHEGRIGDGQVEQRLLAAGVDTSSTTNGSLYAVRMAARIGSPWTFGDDSVSSLREPGVGFEPTTSSLQEKCSAT